MRASMQNNGEKSQRKLKTKQEELCSEELQLQSGTTRQKQKKCQLGNFAPNWQLGSECRCKVMRVAQMNGGKLKAEQSCTARILGFKVTVEAC